MGILASVFKRKPKRKKKPMTIMGLNLMRQRKYKEYQKFIKNYKHPEFTSERFHKHHIVPKCLGGGDGKRNMIVLTISAHWKAHEILARLALPENKKSLTYAYMQFTKQHKSYPPKL